ncbi:MAG: diguanylate cyclase domain-containing protein [Calditrichia bacterium]
MMTSSNNMRRKLNQLEMRVREIENTNLILSSQINELVLLYQATRQLNSTRYSKEVYKSLRSIFRKKFNVEEYAIFIYEEKSRFLTIASSGGLPKRELKEFFYRANEGYVGKVYNTGQPIYLEDISKIKNFGYYHFDKGIHGSVLYLPLNVSPTQNLGVIKLRKSIPGGFSNVERNVLEKLSEPIAIALKKGYEYDEINSKSWLDQVTGLYNHRYFTKRYESEFRRSQRYQHPLSLIFLSVINGNGDLSDISKEEQDYILKKVARYLQDNTRKCDLCIRYSDNHFLILLPETNKESAKEVVGKIRKNWENASVEFPGKDLPLKINITAGLSNYPKDTIEPPMLIKIAEEFGLHQN